MPFIPDQPKKGFIPDKKSVGGFLGNVVKSTGQLVEDTAKAVLSPAETAKNIYRLGSGIIQLAIPGEQGNEQLARAVGKFYTNRYGGLDKAWNSFYNDPAGVVSDLSTVLGIGAGAFKLANASKTAKALSTASKLTDPLNVASKIPKGVKSRANVLPKVGKQIEEYGRTLPTRGLGLPAQREKLTRGGVSIESLMEQFPELYTKDPDVAREVAKQIGERYTKAGLRPDIAIDSADILGRFDKKIAELKSLADRGSEVAGEEFAQLSSIRESLANDLAKNPSLEGLVKYKRDILQPNKPSGAFDPRSYSGKSKAYTTGYEIVKDVGIEANPQLRKLGKQYRTAQGLPDIFTRYQSKSQGNQLLRMPKIWAAAAGGTTAGVPGAVAGILTEQIANSPRGVKMISQATQKAGKKLQKPIKIPSKITRPAQGLYDVSRTSRLLSPAGVSAESDLSTARLDNANSKLSDKQSQNLKQSPQPYTPIIPKEVKYKYKTNVFKNRSAFGKAPRIRIN